MPTLTDNNRLLQTTTDSQAHVTFQKTLLLAYADLEYLDNLDYCFANARDFSGDLAFQFLRLLRVLRPLTNKIKAAYSGITLCCCHAGVLFSRQKKDLPLTCSGTISNTCRYTSLRMIKKYKQNLI